MKSKDGVKTQVCLCDACSSDGKKHAIKELAFGWTGAIVTDFPKWIIAMGDGAGLVLEIIPGQCGIDKVPTWLPGHAFAIPRAPNHLETLQTLGNTRGKMIIVNPDIIMNENNGIICGPFCEKEMVFCD